MLDTQVAGRQELKLLIFVNVFSKNCLFYHSIELDYASVRMRKRGIR